MPNTVRKPFSWVEAAILLALAALALLLLKPWLNNLRPAAQATACTTNLKQLNLAVTQYAQANDGLLPPTDSAASFDAALAAYVPTPSVFLCPDTGQPYVPNPAISRQYVNNIPGDPETVVLAQDPTQDADGLVSVLYLDGTVKHGGVEVGDPIASVADRAKRLALAVTQYTQDNDERYPPTDTPAHFLTAVNPFVRDHRTFYAPNGLPFIPNPALNEVSLASIDSPATTVLLQDQAPYADGNPTTAYADGHVEHVGAIVPDEPAASVVSRAKQLGLATVQYEQDADEILPRTDTPDHFQTDVYPFVKDHATFYAPNGLAFVPNPALSSVSLADIPEPATTVLLQDQPPYVGGAPTICYADGHVTHVAASAHAHLLWTNPDGRAALWSVDPSGTPTLTGGYGPFEDGSGRWKAVGLATGGGDTHLLWTQPGGRAALWDVAADGSVPSVTGYGPYTDTDGSLWTATALALGPDELPRLLWTTPTGHTVLWDVQADGSAAITNVYAPTPDGTTGRPYQAVSLSVGLDATPHLLWAGPSGRAMLWDAKADGGDTVKGIYGPYADDTGAAWRSLSLSHGPDDVGHVLWTLPSGQALLWTLNADSTYRTAGTFGPYTDGSPDTPWTAVASATGPDGLGRLLWTNPDGRAALWSLNAAGGIGSVSGYGPYTDGSPGTPWTPVAVSAGP